MTKDYKRTERRTGGRREGHSLLVGIFIGLVLGLGIALGVAWYINKMPSPFVVNRAPPAADARVKPATPRSTDPAAKAVDAKPRFDFYKILPGSEDAATERSGREGQRSIAPAPDAFFLQAGAFQSAPDADNLKARLALLGVEATIQTTSAPDKGVWHRVRIGPYTSIDELNRARDALKENGVETTLIKARDAGAR